MILSSNTIHSGIGSSWRMGSTYTNKLPVSAKITNTVPSQINFHDRTITPTLVPQPAEGSVYRTTVIHSGCILVILTALTVWTKSGVQQALRTLPDSQWTCRITKSSIKSNLLKKMLHTLQPALQRILNIYVGVTGYVYTEPDGMSYLSFTKKEDALRLSLTVGMLLLLLLLLLASVLLIFLWRSAPEVFHSLFR